jgi:tRNA-specific 2-thiouridylase
VAMSGGVDSSISAYLLKSKGHRVTGVFMRNWDEREESGHCSGEQDYLDAKKVCQQLDIPLLHVWNAQTKKIQVFLFVAFLLCWHSSKR